MNQENRFVIREASSQDVDTLTELSHRTVLTKYPSVIGSEMVQGYVASGAVPTYYAERVAHCRVGVLSGRIVGCCAVRDNSIDLMMVDVDHHGAGIGAALLKDAETRLFKSYDSLFLNSFRDNLQAVGFYMKHGWVEDSQFVDPDYGIAMTKLIKQR